MFCHLQHERHGYGQLLCSLCVLSRWYISLLVASSVGTVAVHGDGTRHSHSMGLIPPLCATVRATHTQTVSVSQ